MLIAITGFARAGKDTTADVICSVKQGFYKESFARKMKGCLNLIFGWTEEYIEKNKDKVDPKWGVSPRQVLTVFGTEFAQFMLCEKYPEFAKVTGRSIWVRALLRNMPKEFNIVVADMRFLHEAKAVKEMGGIIIRVDRPGHPVNRGHASEQDIEKIDADYHLINDGTLEEYQEFVEAWARQNL
jgi:hypothetical protein